MPPLRLSAVTILASILALAGTASAQSSCTHWEPGFQSQDLGASGIASESLVFDDGSGPSLFVGGTFAVAGSNLANNIARWDGSSWQALGAGVDASVAALVEYDDGFGPELFVGGSFLNAGGAPANRIAAWNGTSWRTLGSGLDGRVHELAVWDDGNGPTLYVGGEFSLAGGLLAKGIARWRNGAWSDVAYGVHNLSTFPGIVYSMTPYDDGLGPKLIVAGRFTYANGIVVNDIASWNGLAWAPLGAGLTSTCCTSGVTALAVFDEGAGARLFAGGSDFTTTSLPYEALMRWDGAAWTPVPFATGPLDFAQVDDLRVFDDGSGPALWAAGLFEQAAGIPLTNLLRWDGTSFSTPPHRLGWYAYTLARFDDGNGEATYLGGGNDYAFLPGPKRMAKLDGTSWKPLAAARNEVVTPPVASAVHDDGDGARLFVAGGQLRRAGGASVYGVASFDGNNWSPAGKEIDRVRVLESLHLDGYQKLFAGTAHATGGSPILVWTWTGSAWTPLPGSFAGAGERYVDALAAYDSGGGAELYAGGRFTSIDGTSCSRIARFDGAHWQPLAGGTDDNVYALAVFDDGTGSKLYAGGLFTNAGGVPGTSRIACWNGSQWYPLANGVSGGSPPQVLALEVFDDGAGSALYVGGRFTQAFPAPANNIAKWNSFGWTPLGLGVTGDVLDLLTHDYGDGLGARLVAAGTFATAGGLPAHSLAGWNGSLWSPLTSGGAEGTDGSVSALSALVHPSIQGAGLFVAGSFSRTGDRPARNVGEWTGCDDTGKSFCSGDGTATACPCGNFGAAGQGCRNSTGNGARLHATGQPSLTFDSLVLRGESMTPTSACLYFQGVAAVNGGLGTVFGDGLRCSAGSVVRLGIRANSGGQSHLPDQGDASIASISHPPAGSSRLYQLWYRDPQSFCTSSTFNLSNGLRIVWTH